jgi:hypothetical protein
MINKFIINFYKDRYFNSKAYVSTAARSYLFLYSAH